MRLERHPRFQQFFDGIKEPATRAKLLARIFRLAAGNPGNARSVGEGVMELKLDFGPGWRIYYTTRGPDLVLLVSGGTKARQQQDIELAKQIVRELRR